MKRFQILCVTMNQNDFSKIEEMNIHSDVVFSNQADRTAFDRMEFEGHTAQMITTETRGVGVNRNIGLMYADAEICLFADDDVVYYDDVEERVIKEFEEHPDADIMIFHLDSSDKERELEKYSKTRKCLPIERMPWGAVRIAFRRTAVLKANIWFTTMFGGGCKFPAGEDSGWLLAAKRAGLIFYVSKETIGTVCFENSTWFSGYNKSYFYGKGAFCQAFHARTFPLWIVYYALRIRSNCALTFAEKIKWMRHGKNGYQKMESYDEYIKK